MHSGTMQGSEKEIIYYTSRRALQRRNESGFGSQSVPSLTNKSPTDHGSSPKSSSEDDAGVASLEARKRSGNPSKEIIYYTSRRALQQRRESIPSLTKKSLTEHSSEGKLCSQSQTKQSLAVNSTCNVGSLPNSSAKDDAGVATLEARKQAGNPSKEIIYYTSRRALQRCSQSIPSLNKKLTEHSSVGKLSSQFQIKQSLADNSNGNVENSLHSSEEDAGVATLEARRRSGNPSTSNRIKLSTGPTAKKPSRRKRSKSKRKYVESDEASCLERRARYLLMKIKREQNLIDAYSADGWNGRSREKIRPDKELERAQKQILKSKLGIRKIISELDLLSSVGRTAVPVKNSGVSILQESMNCTKCKSREAAADNEIIQCSGPCKSGFHMKCFVRQLELNRWLCKVCSSRMTVLESVNAHLGTKFSVTSASKDIFREADVCPSTSRTTVQISEEWPSDDSDDEDYSPEINKASSSGNSISENSCDSSVSSILDATDLEMASRRHRTDVDYTKLNEEMFGEETESDDEEWGSGRPKQRAKPIASPQRIPSLISEKSNAVSNEQMPKKINQVKRISADAVKELRQVFAGNELPSRGIKEKLAEQLNLSYEKVNHWFRNARYVALKSREAMASSERGGHGESDIPDSLCSLPLSEIISVRHKFGKKKVAALNSASEEPRGKEKDRFL